MEQCTIRQSISNDGGHCYDNICCKSMWAGIKSELFYGRIDTKRLTAKELKSLAWRCFMSYWNRRRICSLPHLLKRQRYFASLLTTA